MVDAMDNSKVLDTKNKQVKAQQLVMTRAFNATLFILLVIELCNGNILLIVKDEILIFFSSFLL